mmetsp:Transcript_74819/g.124211  ORF Transcript_74819/g.124211 Transcript_74819/m.124211 type:complete len:131 (+) Transcript_74819:1096-1488(+)
MAGNLPSGSSPLRVYASVWHKATCVTLIRTSPFCGGATQISSSFNASFQYSFFGARATAALHLMGAPAEKHLGAAKAALATDLAFAPYLLNICFSLHPVGRQCLKHAFTREQPQANSLPATLLRASASIA